MHEDEGLTGYFSLENYLVYNRTIEQASTYDTDTDHLGKILVCWINNLTVLWH